MGYGYNNGHYVCATKEQTVEHLITSFPLYLHPNGACALSDVDKSLMTWLKKTSLAIQLTICSCPFPPNKEKKGLLTFANLNFENLLLQ